MDQINPKELEAFIRMKEVEAANAAISNSDGVVIVKNEGNVPGSYITADQQLQDVYAQQVAMNNVPGLYGRQSDPGYYGPTPLADMNTVPQGITSPNTTVVEPRNITADANGNIIVY